MSISSQLLLRWFIWTHLHGMVKIHPRSSKLIENADCGKDKLFR